MPISSASFNHSFPSYGAVVPPPTQTDHLGKLTVDKEPDEIPSLLNQRFGWGKFTPEWLQRFNTTRWLLFFMAIGNFAARLGTGALLPPTVTTIQLRFGISNAAIGLIASMNDIVSILIIPIICYLGERYHKGRFVGWGFLLSIVGVLVCTIPQWISHPWLDVISHAGYGGPVVHNLSTQILCLRSNESEALGNPKTSFDDDQRRLVTSSWTSTPLLLFLLGQCIAALGATPVETVGFTYIDENVTQKSSGMYLTLFQISGLLSGVFGFILVALMLTIYGDFYRTPSGAYERLEDSYLWYGCWWMAYVVAAFLSLLAVLPTLGFPRELPRKRIRRAKDKNLTHRSEGNELNLLFGSSWSTYLPFVRQLLRNPAFVLCTISCTIAIFVFSGFLIFMPLYFRYAFDLSDEWAAIYSALALIIPAIVGAVVGGLLLKRRQYSVRELILLDIGILIVTGFLYLALLNYCETPPMAGVNAGYSGLARDWSTSSQLNNSCNQECNCNQKHFSPICDAHTGMEYFSPCYAGCTVELDSNWVAKGGFESCGCGRNVESHEDTGDLRFRVGSCPRGKGCFNRRIFVLTILSVASFIQGIEIAPFDQIILRSVDFSSRILAKGMQMAVIRLFGIIPGPIVFGLALDTCCMIWKNEQSRDGQCLKYSIGRMTNLLVSLTMVVRVFSFLLLTGALLLYKPLGGVRWWSLIVAKLLGRTNINRVEPLAEENVDSGSSSTLSKFSSSND